MKISVDGGGLGINKNNRFGNYVFSLNLIKALLKYDKKNQYYIYKLNKDKHNFAWLKLKLSLKEIKNKKDVFLALNQAIPLYVSGKIITFCHGLSYFYHPNLYSLKDTKRLKKQLYEMINRSNYIIVSSIKIKNELLSINQSIDKKIIILPFGIPFDMLEKKTVYNKFIKTNDKKNYFLFVGMNHSIKNIDFIKLCFNEYKKFTHNKNTELKLITENCSRSRLRYLYLNAKALLTASYYESFNFPVLEALSQGTSVIGLKSAIIPELAPYVNIALDKKEFVNNMINISNKPEVNMIKKIKKDFSWKNYVKKLVELYQ